MKKNVSDLALLVQGEFDGDGSKIITGASGLIEASENDVSFVKSDKDATALNLFSNTKAGAVFVPLGFNKKNRSVSTTLIEVKNPLAAFSVVLNLMSSEKNVRPNQIHPMAYVSPKAKIGKNVSIGAFSIIEEGAELEDEVWLHGQNYIGARTKVGRGTILYPQVVLREDILVGKNCIFHPGCVIGADGYGFFFDGGKHEKIPQVGTVVIEDDVEIGASSTVDRATTGATLIRRGTKIDNLVQVAHNVEIGEHSLLAAQVGIAGSSKLGKGVVLGGQSGVADHIKVADQTQVGGQGGVTKDTVPGAILWGTPAQPLPEELRKTLLLRKLPDLFKDVKKLKGKFKENA